jgi:microcystin-dependent protein
MTVLLSPIWSGGQFFDQEGNPLSGGKIFQYAAGSFTTLATTWTTDAGNVENPNPIILDSSGRAQNSMFLDPTHHYNLALTDPSGDIVLESVDGVAGIADTTYLNQIISDLGNIYLAKAGGTITGGLAVNGSTQLHETSIAGNLTVTGKGSFTGIDANGKVANVTAPTNATDAATKKYVDDKVSGGVGGISVTPIGGIMAWPVDAIPAGWFKCNGQLVSKVTYPTLFALLGITYGPGNADNFALPDFRAMFLRGVDEGRGNDLGRVIGSTQADEFKSHDHKPLFLHGSNADNGDPGDWVLTSGSQDNGLRAFPDTHGTANGGAETRPVNVAIHWIIKAV